VSVIVTETTDCLPADHLSGKPGNVRECETCHRNVRDFVNSQGKNLVRENCPKNCSLLVEYLRKSWLLCSLKISSISFKTSAQLHIFIHSDFILRTHYEVNVKLIVWSLTLTLVVQTCYEYHLTWAWVLHIVTELSGEWSLCVSSLTLTPRRGQPVCLVLCIYSDTDTMLLYKSAFMFCSVLQQLHFIWAFLNGWNITEIRK